MNSRQYALAPTRRPPAEIARRGSYGGALMPALEAGKWRRVMDELEKARMGWYSLSRPETKIITTVLHDWEHIAAAIYGYSPQGFAMLVATDRRILFVSKKILSTQVDEAPFHSVEGVSVSAAPFLATLTLHTKIGNFSIQTVNFLGATRFVEYVERMIEEEEQREQEVEI